MGQVIYYMNVFRFQYPLAYFYLILILFFQTSETRSHSVDRQHKDGFVGWFERKVSANLFILLGLSCTSPEKKINYFSI
jgi:hypothetical protein